MMNSFVAGRGSPSGLMSKRSSQEHAISPSRSRVPLGHGSIMNALHPTSGRMRESNESMRSIAVNRCCLTLRRSRLLIIACVAVAASRGSSSVVCPLVSSCSLRRSWLRHGSEVLRPTTQRRQNVSACRQMSRNKPPNTSWRSHTRNPDAGCCSIRSGRWRRCLTSSRREGWINEKCHHRPCECYLLRPPGTFRSPPSSIADRWRAPHSAPMARALFPPALTTPYVSGMLPPASCLCLRFSTRLGCEAPHSVLTAHASSP